MFDARLSKEIFQELMNGRAINKRRLDNSSNFMENELFNEIIKNEEEYRRQYKMAGYEFILNNSFILIREKGFDSSILKTDATMKAYTLLLLIGKYLNDYNYRITKLEDINSGLNIADIEAIEAMSETKELLEKADMKTDLFSNIKSVLVARNILLEKAGSNVYLLSDSGKAFFDELVASNHFSTIQQKT